LRANLPAMISRSGRESRTPTTRPKQGNELGKCEYVPDAGSQPHEQTIEEALLMAQHTR
jgi:hypothetical protein